MKLFTQVALVSAMAACGSAYAMQAMDDSALASTTGRDGITIQIQPGVGTSGISIPTGMTGQISIDQLALIDRDGVTASGSAGSEAGAIVLGESTAGDTTTGTRFDLQTSGPITVKIDSTGGGLNTDTNGAAPYLNVAITLPSKMSITTGDIWVEGAAKTTVGLSDTAVQTTYTTTFAADGGTNAAKILNSLNISLGGSTLSIKLGNPGSDGAFIAATGTISGGLTISNVGVNDNYISTSTVANEASTGLWTKTGDAANNLNGGTLGVGNILLTDNGSTDLSLNASINLVHDADYWFNSPGHSSESDTGVGGLVLTLNSAKYDAYLQDVTLGSTASMLGDVAISGLDLTGTKIAITGH